MVIHPKKRILLPRVPIPIRPCRSGDFRDLSGMGVSRDAAFTLVELIVGIAILGILIAISIPAIGHLQASADMTGCMNNLRQIGQIVQTVAADSDGRIPLIRNDEFTGDMSVVAGTEYKEASTLVKFLEAYGGTADLLICPAEKRRHHTSKPNYQWMPIYGKSLISAPKIDGMISLPASDAPLVVESAMVGEGAEPHTSSGVPAANSLMADGSVKTNPKKAKKQAAAAQK